MQELQELYEIYNDVVLKHLRNPRQYDEYGKRVSVDSDMYKAIIKYYGYDKKPEIVSDEDYISMDKKEVYHGFTHFSHGLELLFSVDKYNLGTGGYTPGLFFTSDKSVGVWYTNHGVEGLDEDEARVLNVKINSENFMEFDELQDLIVSPILDLPPNTKQEHREKIKKLYEFCKKMKDDGKSVDGFLKTMKKLSNFGVYLGLDWIEEQDYEHTIVFNRNCLSVSESTAKRFMGEGEKLKDLPQII